MERMRLLMTMFLAMSFVGCNVSKDAVKKVLKENPDVLAEAIKENPVEFMDAVREAAQIAQQGEAERRQKEEQEKLAEAYDNPLVPEIRSDENILGPKDAPLTLVEYSDFECPFCSRAFNTVQELRNKYGKNLRFIYKHLPLSFHPNAMMAAQYYEAIRMQSPEKAWKYHDELLKNLSKVKNGEKYFKSVAKSLGVNVAKAEKDANGSKVKARIEADMKEAEKFGFRGTPGFLLNGIPVKGAYPTSHFDGIVEELKKRGKVNI